jgi:hypothetical protein
MKRILLAVFFLISFSAYAQKLPDFGVSKVRITEADKTVTAEIMVVGSDPSVRPSLFYYWYNAGVIHSTQGGFSGKLLNGQYNEFYLNKNLKQQGSFKKGLKNGSWKSWSEDGTLILFTTWKNGIIVTKPHRTFWQKINIFKKNKGAAVPDTLAKPKP